MKNITYAANGYRHVSLSKKQCLNSLRYSIMLKLVGYLFSSIYAKFYIVSEVLFVYMPKITRDS